MGRIAEYYARQLRKNRGRVAATLMIPWLAVVACWWRVIGAPRGNPVKGYGLHHLPLLVSYPRCGTNWCRYVIEALTGGPTPGQRRLHVGTRYVIDRAHDATSLLPHYRSAILLIRDYRECLLRNHAELWQQCDDVRAFLEADYAPEPPRWFIDNIAAFDVAEIPGLVVYYEDLLKQPATEIRRLGAFFGLDETRVEKCVGKVDQMFERSVAAYTSGGHASLSAARRDPGYHARRLLTDRQARAFDTWFEANYPVLFARYLERYRIA